MMEQKLKKDIIEWDVHNWSQALDFWTAHVDLNTGKMECLELGGRQGGLSLWLASKGHKVVCSDLDSPEEYASKLHSKYPFADLIKYEAIDATRIPYENQFDLVVFKSILGGISRGGNHPRKQESVDQIYKALKPSGKLLFAETLEASSLHKYHRKKFIKWADDWNYLKYSDLAHLFHEFENVKFQTVGFFGAFGRSEGQRNFLGKIDSLLKPFLPKQKRYIVFVIAEKGNFPERGDIK